MQVNVGDILFYRNNNQPEQPCVVMTVHSQDVVSVSVGFQNGWAFRSSVHLWRGSPDQYKYPGGEFVYFREKDLMREKQWPLNPDLW